MNQSSQSEKNSQNAMPSFATAYAQGNLHDFFALPLPKNLTDKTQFENALSQPRAIERQARQTLVTALSAYATATQAPKAVQKSLEHLQHPNSRVVITGQQVGLLLGPNYTLAKAVTAITLAAQLHTAAQPVVPMFWLASQDHDSAEIDHSYILDNSENLHRLSVPLPAGVPAGKIKLQAHWIDDIVEQIKQLPSSELGIDYREEVLELLTQTATATLNSKQHHSFADWFARLLYQLLGEQGLIIVNPLVPDIAKLFKPILQQELQIPRTSSQYINATGDRLNKAGYTPQLGRGDDATNIFFTKTSEENNLPQRHLLRFREDVFYYGENITAISKEEILAQLEQDPTCLTPAAGLRPITQDAALPTAITVVGPGELRYFAQLKKVYALHDVAMPLIYPRLNLTILEPPVKRILEKFRLEVDDLYADFATIRNNTLLELHGHEKDISQALANIEKASSLLLEHLQQVDPTLLLPAERNSERITNIIGNMRQKTAQALARQDNIYAHQFTRLEHHLLPLNTPQERLISPFSYFLKFGIANVMEKITKLPPHGHHLIEF